MPVKQILNQPKAQGFYEAYQQQRIALIEIDKYISYDRL